jgi:tellurite resistance protein TerC
MITLKGIKRIVILVVGGTVLLLGIALLVLPGPAFIVIPVGLAILAIEFAWARRWLRRMRELVQQTQAKTRPDGVRAAGLEQRRPRILAGYGK